MKKLIISLLFLAYAITGNASKLPQKKKLKKVIFICKDGEELEYSRPSIFACFSDDKRDLKFAYDYLELLKEYNALGRESIDNENKKVFKFKIDEDSEDLEQVINKLRAIKEDENRELDVENMMITEHTKREVQKAIHWAIISNKKKRLTLSNIKTVGCIIIFAGFVIYMILPLLSDFMECLSSSSNDFGSCLIEKQYDRCVAKCPPTSGIIQYAFGNECINNCSEEKSLLKLLLWLWRLAQK